MPDITFGQGTVAGAAAGAAIGSAIAPGPGTVIGGAAGAVVGAVLSVGATLLGAGWLIRKSSNSKSSPAGSKPARRRGVSSGSGEGGKDR
jgi:hypothetical protein